ncbi:transmembrane protein [Perilla frutescens var. frutescens]|nr:transmembrane protein [Perilla frutescens var. frutescens]
MATACPPHSFVYNGSLCACNPGYLYNRSTNACGLFTAEGPALQLSSGVDYGSAFSFPGTIFSFDSIKKFTQSQAVFLEATLVILLFWLAFCLLLRLFPRAASDGRSALFRTRWWISRLDVAFATRHWLHDQHPVVKRKTELGGAFSIASWILFIGLFAALLYQTISKRSVEVHSVRAANAPDLASFLNDMEFNITTISNMSCAQLRGLDTLVTGNPFFFDQRSFPLSTFANYSCLNTTAGPTITIRCNKCRLIRDFAYISWQFVDLPNIPATALAFHFNLSAKKNDRKNHLSFVSGTVSNASDFDHKPLTYRGAVPNILKFNLFPRLYRNLHDLKLIQPLFHDFLPGSSFSEVTQLQASLQNSRDGLINTTLVINFLSSYIVEIDNQNILGPVSFLADLGGLYCISVGIFFCLLVQCEYRITRLRYEDTIMKNIRNRRKAQDRWDKLRKYVRYTWGSCSLDDSRTEQNMASCTGVMMKSLHQRGSSRKHKMEDISNAVDLSKTATPPNEKKVEVHNSQEVRSCSIGAPKNLEGRSSFSICKPEEPFDRSLEHKSHEEPKDSSKSKKDNAVLLREKLKAALPKESPSVACVRNGNEDLAGRGEGLSKKSCI